MGMVETEGLVLRTYNFSDADKVVVFLTKDHGLVRGVAKGARRLKSAFGSSLEPFSISQIAYFKKEQQDLASIKSAEIRNSHFSNASDPLFLQKFTYIAELLIFFAPPEEPNVRLYNMTRICLETASPDRESLDRVLLYFELWLLKLGGYLPDWSACFECGNIPEDDSTVSVQSSFQILCNDCQRTRTAVILSPEERAVFDQIQKIGPGKFLEMDFEINSVRRISEILKKLISTILGGDSHETRIFSTKY
jgi:DNA repair protein RecO (recombination protein O)